MKRSETVDYIENIEGYNRMFCSSFCFIALNWEYQYGWIFYSIAPLANSILVTLGCQGRLSEDFAIAAFECICERAFSVTHVMENGSGYKI